MLYTVYRTKCLTNGKIYIGKHQTKNINDGYLGSGKLLQRAIKKYGIENFSKEILFSFDNEEEMNSKEKELVNEEYLKRDDIYNLCPGGQGGFGYINENNLNTSFERTSKGGKSSWIINGNPQKEILKNLNLLKKMTDKRTITRNMLYGSDVIKNMLLASHKPEVEEKRKNTRLKNKHAQGEKNSQFGTCWITNGIENKKIKKEDLYLWLEQGYNKGRKVSGQCSGVAELVNAPDC